MPSASELFNDGDKAKPTDISGLKEKVNAAIADQERIAKEAIAEAAQIITEVEHGVELMANFFAAAEKFLPVVQSVMAAKTTTTDSMGSALSRLNDLKGKLACLVGKCD